MIFKKKSYIEIDTNYVKKEIINWVANQSVEVKMIDIHLGDYRDGTEDRIEVFVFFNTNAELEKYKSDGFISKLKSEIMHLLDDAVSQGEKINFVFDYFSNRNLYFWLGGTD